MQNYCLFLIYAIVCHTFFAFRTFLIFLYFLVFCCFLVDFLHKVFVVLTSGLTIFSFPRLIRCSLRYWRHLEGGEASVKRYLMTDADKERSPKDESKRLLKVAMLPTVFISYHSRYHFLCPRC